MRWLRAGILTLLSTVCVASDTPAPVSLSPCSDNRGAPRCQAPAKDLKLARQAFSRGLKLQHAKQLDEAFVEFEEASRLIPQNLDYVTAREMLRQQVVATHLERGNQKLQDGRQAEALAEFRIALNTDPQNEFAQQRVKDALGGAQVRMSAAPQLVASAETIAAQPNPEHHDFHYRGDSRGLLTAIVASYGLTVVFDDSFPSRRVRFDLEDVDFPKAVQAAEAVTKSFTVPIDGKTLFAALNTPENHRQYDRMGLRSFYIAGGSTTQELNDILNSLRSLFELRFVSLNPSSSMVTIRGPQGTLEAATQFLESLDSTRPEVMLDVKVFQVDHSYVRNIGIHIPNQFKLFNIPTAALAALGGQNIQDLINQLVASGGINQAGNESIAALLAQLQSQQGSIFSQPLATFGGGLTFMGLSLDELRATLSLNESSVRELEHVTMRGSHDRDTTLKVGSRYPILNASFSPIFNSQAIAQVIGNQSFTAPFPSVNYEDIGLNVKIKPSVTGNSDVNLQVEMQVRVLGTVSFNGIPVISNREYKGGIALKDGEPAVVAGMITKSEQRSLAGIPGFSQLPVLKTVASENGKQDEDDEILVVITPYVVRDRDGGDPPVIWLGK